ncbi:hypothetical protein A2U01_0097675 [Trifolium medium]|nr:hypothetical protein [Trifolium medium]
MIFVGEFGEAGETLGQMYQDHKRGRHTPLLHPKS